MAVPFVASSPDPEVPEKAQRRKFSVEDKKRILEDVDRAMGHGGIGAVLRRQNQRLQEELEKAHIVIDVQKKVAKLLGRPIPEIPSTEK